MLQNEVSLSVDKFNSHCQSTSLIHHRPPQCRQEMFVLHVRTQYVAQLITVTLTIWGFLPFLCLTFGFKGFRHFGRGDDDDDARLKVTRQPGLAGSRMSPFCMLLEPRTMEVVMTSGVIRRAKLQANRHHQQTNNQHFTGRMPFLSPNQQCQSTQRDAAIIAY